MGTAVTHHLVTGRIVALAGRRVDAPGATPPRFPPGNIERVSVALAVLFADLHAVKLVCSAACGADLLALEAAQSGGVQCRIVLPFDAIRFRNSSVVDRPGRWGALFDAAIHSCNDVIVLAGNAADDDTAYAAATERIVQEAEQIACVHGVQHGEPPIAVVVWDGSARGDDDATAQFAGLARAHAWPVYEVNTL